MNIPKREKINQKKNTIISALGRCLQRDVYSRITIQEIADEAGFSKGGVLHYFSTKEEIYIELLQDILGGFEKSHHAMITKVKGDALTSLSALMDVEHFILEKNNIRIIINFILYSFEEEKIMKIIQEFVQKHNEFYATLIEASRKGMDLKRKSDMSPENLSRMVQAIVLFTGVLETIDPTNMDSALIVKFLSSMLRG